ncbi:GNAT family N-acetyltransferase [Aureibacillus halotolerans]|uniref:RimJ/RimL family protein N-acetyltransferase n=1 Tax=Aureibacillus halotolerans TaxID=1508390 RepID=A0A4R6TVM2_9BACI|nr:GNAT family N-acetyltransferase [Aureibacillus halotolerans]TDQ37471.1 RimJ/RimL family protein N-acetyltransferase [Aureibacillus halotolerans]
MHPTQRLQFRRYTMEDLMFYTSLWQHPDVVRFIGNGQKKTSEEARRSLQYWVLPGYKDGLGLHLILDAKTHQPIGHAGLVRQLVDGRTEIEIGYWLLPEYWGKGLAKEAAAACMDYGENVLGIQRFICLIHPNHPASIFVALRIGMAYEKTSAYNGRDVLVYANTASM